jgi:3-hydroxy-9,10-secoandrosta-1,3,5(10)-triene-9,17-dione monooxygenase reductase component
VSRVQHINDSVEASLIAGYGRAMLTGGSALSGPEVDSVEAIAPAHFRAVLGHFPTGVTVITAIDDDRPVGMAVGSFFSLSLDPPLVGFCVARSSSSWPAVRHSGRFCANVLAADQQTLCRQFAVSGGDKFAGLSWQPGATGAPRLDGVLAWVDCTIVEVYPGGDHEICIGRVAGLAVNAATGRSCSSAVATRSADPPSGLSRCTIVNKNVDNAC